MRCSFSLLTLTLSCYIFMTDAQNKLKSKVLIMEDDEIASLLNDMQSEPLQSKKKVNRPPKSRSLPFINKQPVLRMEKPSNELDVRGAATPKVHFMDDAELEEILNDLNAQKTRITPALENVEVNVVKQHRLEPSLSENPNDRLDPTPAERPIPRISLDNIPLQDYNKVLLVVDPNAVKDTENQAMLTDLIGKVMTARQSRRDDDDDLAAQYAKLARTADLQETKMRDFGRSRDRERDREKDRERDRDRERKREREHERDRDRELEREESKNDRNSEREERHKESKDTSNKNMYSSRTARPLGRGQNRDVKYSDEER